MPAPSTGRDLHVDVPLSNIVQGRRPDGFIADQLIPITPVSKQSDMWYKFNHLEWRRHENGLTLRAPSTEAKKVHMTVSSDTYFAPNYELGTSWPVEDEVNADQVLQWSQSAANFLTDRLMMDYEMRVAGIATTSSNVGTIFVAASAWSDDTNATPLSDLNDWKESFRRISGKTPNVLILPERVLANIRLNNQCRDVLVGLNNAGIATPQQIGNFLGIPKVLVPTIQVNTAAEADPQTGSLADVWGGNIWMARVDTLAGMMTDTWINAFRWTNSALGVPMGVQRFPFDPKKKCYDLAVGYYQTEKVVSSDLAIRVGSLDV